MPTPLLTRVVPTTPATRTIALATLVNTVGGGMLMPLSALYFTAVVGLPVAQVAVVLGVAAFAGMLSGVPWGHLADRVGARRVLVWLLFGMGVLTACLLAVGEIWSYALVMLGLRVLDRGVAGVAAALIAVAVPGAAERTRARALLRSIMFTGLAVGTGLSAVIVTLGSGTAARVGIVADAVTCVAAGLVYLRLPARPPGTRAQRTSPWRALRDRPFVALVASFAVLGMYGSTLGFAMPLWVAGSTDVPPYAIPAAFVVNTVAHMLAQVPIARRITTRDGAVRAAVVGGVAPAVACLLLAATAWLTPVPAMVVLGMAILCGLFGGLCSANAQFYLSTELAPENAQGQYQGLVSSGTALSAMLAPGVLTALPLERGTAGWVVLAVLFAAAGIGVVGVVRWAGRRTVLAVVAPSPHSRLPR